MVIGCSRRHGINREIGLLAEIAPAGPTIEGAPKRPVVLSAWRWTLTTQQPITLAGCVNRDGSVVLYFEADSYCHLEFLHFAIYDPSALFDYVEPVHMTHGMRSFAKVLPNHWQGKPRGTSRPSAQVTKRGVALRAASRRVCGNLDLVVCPRPDR